MTASWAANHPAFEVDRRRGRHGPAHLGDQPHRARAPPIASPRRTPRPTPASPAPTLPAAPDTALHAVPTTGSDPGHRGERLEHGQCTPCPAWKKKLTMAGAAPISSAARAETSTVFRPLKDWW